MPFNISYYINNYKNKTYLKENMYILPNISVTRSNTFYTASNFVLNGGSYNRNTLFNNYYILPKESTDLYNLLQHCFIPLHTDFLRSRFFSGTTNTYSITLNNTRNYSWIPHLPISSPVTDNNVRYVMRTSDYVPLSCYFFNSNNILPDIDILPELR